jgi:hypothetical protein
VKKEICSSWFKVQGEENMGTSKEAKASFYCLFQVDGDALALCTLVLVYFARALFQGGWCSG